MNLIDRDELQKDVQVWHQQLEEGCVQELDPTEATDRFEEMLLSQIVIDPATLDIAALKMWEELMEIIAEWENHNCAPTEYAGEIRVGVYRAVLNQMLDLESRFDLAEARKVLEQSRAWDKLWDKDFDPPGLDWRREVGFKNYALAQARADLAKGEGNEE